MQFINYLGQDAYTNIAMDSWLLYHLKPTEPVFALWHWNRFLIVGSNKSAGQYGVSDESDLGSGQGQKCH